MKKIVILNLLLLGVVFLAGCSLPPMSRTQTTTSSLWGEEQTTSSETQQAQTDTKNIALPFQNYIPLKFSDGLELTEQDRRSGSAKFREVDIYNLESWNGDKITKRISVDDGYGAMYSYPNTQYFANVKIEKSVKGEFKKDKAIVIEYTKHLFDRKTRMVKDYSEQNPEVKKKIDAGLATVLKL